MVVALPFRYDLWSNSDSVREEESIEVHCLLPNGNYINFKCKTATTLEDMKEVSESCTCEKQNYYWLRHKPCALHLCYHFIDAPSLFLDLKRNYFCFFVYPFR